MATASGRFNPASGSAAAAAVAPAAAPAKNPLLVPIVAVVGVLAVAGGVIGYVNHSQAQQRAELEKLLKDKEQTNAPAQNTAAPAAGLAPAITATTPAPPVPEPPVASQVNDKPAASVQPPVVGKKKDAAASAASVELSLASTPSGAKVQIDGKADSDWTTPFTTKLGPGQHTVTFTKSGYVGETKTVAIAAGKPARLDAKLSEALLAISLNSDPPGAAIEVDGKPTGKVTPSVFPLSKGDHTFVFRKDGFQDLSKKATFKEGDALTLNGSLKPVQKESGNIFKKLFGGDKVSLQVNSTPQGAEIYVEGNYVNKKTPGKISLPPGDHEVQLKLDGYTTVTRKITVQKDTPLTIDETLKK
jgi:hypothetical protein